MFQAHGVGYAEYSRKLEQQLRVEKRRQEDYEKSKQIVQSLGFHN
ncbi:hypothetical protein JOC83_002482 [Bacillus iocasae]|uniref:Uncharacterized protein n=1 Tax=Priestia iocasae TaxID=2291674 RepID=A0ABS2QVX1_9BACI|nr:hypothetical protein [Metabacillus iocasae]